MARYIDADALMKEIDREVKLSDHWKTAHEMANVIKYFPTADVVEVVRCKDCKWYEETDARIGTCLLVERGAEINGFCSWGERRTDDDRA